MRLLALTLLSAATLLAASPSRAQTYDPNFPVCLQVFTGFADSYFECAYTSLEQCRMSASGRAAQCVVNPFYAGPPAQRPRGKRHRRAH